MEREVRELLDLVEPIISFIGEYGRDEDLKDDNWRYACDVVDTLYWVLGEIDTEDFLSDTYLNLEKLKRIVARIERKTGKSFSEFKKRLKK
ncbi:hypothetical protein DKAM_1129 [Desulfurococcus amylolyticus 1221n]|uniref:NTP pyrophosphohydrolase MazG putative catalytic core domain-containing protein n=1 Tax=Desulfurococcus amylolyticus (strain DSM 18924 / JCM 16383 / VKM B-2413 / 1221n) TaxID=490899 RepID=B8D5S4_DESA1|nr:hypothetical protein DKAM_1129 [Desulfurococcus amylolyticus 1221n]